MSGPHRRRQNGPSHDIITQPIRKCKRGSLYGRLAETIRKFLGVRGNDQPSHFACCFLRHIERYLYLTWSTCSSTIDIYIQSTFAPKEQLYLHTRVRKSEIVNPSQFCSFLYECLCNSAMDIHIASIANTWHTLTSSF